MKKTNPLTLLILGPVGFGIGFLFDLLLVGSGRPMITVPWTMSLCLALIGIASLLLGLRVKWATKPGPGRRIDPIVAVQILTVAKASSITGSLVTGFTAGLLVFILSRAQVAASVLPQTVVGVVSAFILLVCAVIAERLCRIPPSDSEAEPA
jgi:LytS/YehU family sensor histidine kinase